MHTKAYASLHNRLHKRLHKRLCKHLYNLLRRSNLLNEPCEPKRGFYS